MNITKTIKKRIHSSSWLQGWNTDSILTKSMTQLERQNHDIYKLASGKRAIANFVNIVTNKNIPVVFKTDEQSYTDGKTVTIGSKITDPADFDIAVGLALHEGSHIKLSDFELVKDIASLVPIKLQNRATKLNITDPIMEVKNLWNWVEDRRIDHFIYSTSPGYRAYYQAMYGKYFNSNTIDVGLKSTSYTDETMESYSFRIINIHNKNTNLDVLNGLREIYNTIGLRNIERLKSSQDALDVALEVFGIILDNVDPTKKQRKDGEGKGKDGDGSGKGDGSDGEPQTLTDEEFQKMLDGMDSNSTGGSTGGGTPIKLTPKQLELLKKKIQKQKDFLDGKVDKQKIDKQTNQNIQAVEESGSELKSVGQDMESNGYGSYNGVECVVVKKLTNSLLHSSEFPMTSTYSGKASKMYEAEVLKGIQLGTILGKKLQVRSESRTTVFNRQKIGRIDKRMIASLGYGNESVFQFNDVDSYNNANLHVSIDASGSMCGSKWTQTMINIVAMCKAVDMISGLDIQVTFRTTQNYKPYIVMAYNSKVDKFSKVKQIFPCLDPGGTTPEGLCYEAIMKEFLPKSNTLDSYFINLSDGQPYFSGHNFQYGGDSAARHTRKMVNKIEKMGIKTISYYVSSGYSSSMNGTFKTMYGKGARDIDVTNLSEITKTMNRMFMEKEKN